MQATKRREKEMFFFLKIYFKSLTTINFHDLNVTIGLIIKLQRFEPALYQEIVGDTKWVQIETYDTVTFDRRLSWPLPGGAATNFSSIFYRTN